MTSFDLSRNPFVILGVDLSASAKEVADAFEEAVVQARYPQAELTAARQALLRPLLRLQAEVSSLLDTPRREWRTILTALRHSQSVTAFRDSLGKIPALSRSNILTQYASRTPSDTSILMAWVIAHGEIRLDALHSELQRFHKAAGIAPPERTAVAAALNELREQQSRAVFDGFAGPSDAIEAVTTSTKNIISGENDDNITALSVLLNAYHRYIDQELSFRRERIKVTAADLAAEPDGSGNLAMVIDALKFWNVAANPLQLLEASKSRSEPYSLAVFQEIRSVAIELANATSRFDVALSLTTACQIEFANLPRAREQLAEDEGALKDRAAAAKIEPLVGLITKLDDELHSLATDLKKCGFGNSAAGLAKSLRDTFVASVHDSKDGAAKDLPWIMLRSVAVKLNNDRENPDAALALIQGLLELARQLDVFNEVIQRLPDDKRAVERNRLEVALIGHLKSNRYHDALSTIENLLRDFKSSEERDTLQSLKQQLERKRTRKYLRWGFWAAVIGGGIVFASVDNSPSPALHTPSDTYTAPARDPARNRGEEIPPVGTGRQFNEANVRYCKFQKARLQFIQPHLVENFQINAFNRLVDDYNSRCGSFQYWQNDLSEVETELAQRQAELEAQAQRIINGWSVPR